MIRLALAAVVLSLAPQESPRAKELWEKLGPLFAPPERLKGDLGKHRPVLTFEDGRAVKTPDDWQDRRREILKKWNDLLGPWPPLLEKPFAHEQFKETVEGFTRRRIELEVAPGRKTGIYLLTPD